MAKRKNVASFKGLLEVDFNIGSGTITEVVKDVESEYDFFKVLKEFNGKQISVNITEENEIETVGEGE